MESFKEFLVEGQPRVTRAAFIYMDPKGDENNFAECGTCVQWGENERCKLFGPNDKVKSSWTCGLYAHGKPQKKVIPLKSVSPREAGLVKKSPRCENCYSFDAKENKCSLYQSLNEKLPELFQLNTSVHPKGCCNAWT